MSRKRHGTAVQPTLPRRWHQTGRHILFAGPASPPPSVLPELALQLPAASYLPPPIPSPPFRPPSSVELPSRCLHLNIDIPFILFASPRHLIPSGVAYILSACARSRPLLRHPILAWPVRRPISWWASLHLHSVPAPPSGSIVESNQVCSLHPFPAASTPVSNRHPRPATRQNRTSRPGSFTIHPLTPPPRSIGASGVAINLQQTRRCLSAAASPPATRSPCTRRFWRLATLSLPPQTLASINRGHSLTV